MPQYFSFAYYGCPLTWMVYGIIGSQLGDVHDEGFLLENGTYVGPRPESLRIIALFCWANLSSRLNGILMTCLAHDVAIDQLEKAVVRSFSAGSQADFEIDNQSAIDASKLGNALARVLAHQAESFLLLQASVADYVFLEYNYRHNWVGWCVVVLLGMTAFCHMLTVLALTKINFQKR